MHPGDRLGIASATLKRAAMFMGAGLHLGIPASSLYFQGPVVKVIANGLREMDRFLNLLIDEVAAVLALPDIDLARFSRQRNTANKLRSLRTALALPSPNHLRLRALGRSRDCLFYSAGIVRRADARGGDAMTAGWPGSRSPRVIPIGRPLRVRRSDLAEVGGFYMRIAEELVALAPNS